MTNDVSESRRDRVVNLTVVEIHSNADLAGLISIGDDTMPTPRRGPDKWAMGHGGQRVVL